MIQTHFVKLEPPYQIIHYGGVVGIQIGTLIVVGESNPGDSASIDIITHSHPVVSYVDKLQLKAKLGKERCDNFKVSQWGGGEGNVWSKVEVSDVEVIGLWDVDQDHETCHMEWDDFTSLVNDGFSYMDAKKGISRKYGIYELYRYLERVGLTPVPPPPADYCVEIGLSLHRIKYSDGIVRKFVQCSELNCMDQNRPIRIMFYAMYDAAHLNSVINNINHNVFQYLSILKMPDAELKFVTFADEDIGEDNLYYNPEDEENLQKIVEQLNDIYSK